MSAYQYQCTSCGLEHNEIEHRCQPGEIYDLRSKVTSLEAELKEARDCLNWIAIYGSGEMAYTADFTTNVMGRVRKTLKGNLP